MELDPRDLARSNSVIQQTLSSSDFPRLEAALPAGRVPIVLCLKFSLDGNDRVRIEGTAEFTPAIECHRCLRVVPTRVSQGLNICIVRSGKEADEVMEFADPVIHADRIMDIQALVEDDLLLGLPRLAAPHGVECSSPRSTESGVRPDRQPGALSTVLDLKEQVGLK